MALNFGGGWNPGTGEFFFNISTDNVEVAKYVCKIAGQGVIGLGALYLGYQAVRPLIETAVKNGLGGERDDQEVRDIGSGSLNVLLHCFTDERFLEVLADYESGSMKESLQKEFLKVGIKVVGLKVKIENMAQVEKTKKGINERSYMNKDLYEDVKNIVIDDPERDPTMNVPPISTMAYRIETDQQGYDNTRFEGPVKDDLLCSICQGVLKNPRTCQNKEHPFCLSCISQHLRNSHTCPECREHLTPETLKDPPRFLKNTLSELNIKCDYSERGCLDYVQLENLQNHVERCDFAPVMCGNKECGMVVNKRDKEIHEKDLCQFRIPRCHDCKDMKASQDEMKASQDEIKECQGDIKVKIDEMEIKQVNMIKKFQSEMKAQNEEIERKQDEMKKNNDKIKDSQAHMKVELNEMKEKITKMEKKQDDMKDEMKVELKEMKDKMTVMERKQNRTMHNVDEMRWQFDEMMIMVQQALQGRNTNNNDAQAIDPAVPANQQDIIIIGGFYAPGLESVLKTVEKYNIAEGKSTLLPAMNLARAGSASCVYNGDVIVAGGYDGQDGTDSIEILKMNQHPLRWTMFDEKLPVKLNGHDITVYKDNLYITGGDNWNEKKISDIIYKQSLTPPYTVQLLSRMPQQRRNHKADIVNDKLLILGGSTTTSSKDNLDSVIMYDFIKNEIKPCPSLPKPVRFMCTVAWGNMIILIGGRDTNDQVLNDVIMYDTETGRSERLPSLKHKRSGASAVIMHDVIVVLGGYNKEEKWLNSVESFKMGDDQWKELPGMKEKRNCATAVVKRRN